MTGYLRKRYAAAVRHRPERNSKLYQCHGQVTTPSRTRPLASGPPLCGQAASVTSSSPSTLKTAYRRPLCLMIHERLPRGAPRGTSVTYLLNHPDGDRPEPVELGPEYIAGPHRDGRVQRPRHDELPGVE